MKKKYVKLYLDDIRNPKGDDWIIVRSYKEFVDYILKNGLPDLISFDHDLSDKHHIDDSNVESVDFKNYYDIQNREMTGYDCAKWLGNYCWDNGIPIPEWNIHSANMVGTENISSYLKFLEGKLN